ncbi:hypothetical protein [Vibrio sonorensis]|uniref:hypothetical protein n=1 Tax=Vibrio sonorensis TaxID=1004316 RepID=UPI0008DAD88D|nr:hypothetical protein [Vibrio sonorensis]
MTVAVGQEHTALQGESYLALAQASLVNDNYTLANDYAKRALALAEEHNNAHLHAISLRSLADIAELEHDYKKAHQLFRQYADFELKIRDNNHHHAFWPLILPERSFGY